MMSLLLLSELRWYEASSSKNSIADSDTQLEWLNPLSGFRHHWCCKPSFDRSETLF